MIDPALTPAEMAAIRSGLGLSRPQEARLLGVNDRSIGQWEAGTHAAPAGACRELRGLDELATRAVEDLVAALHGEADPVLAIPSSADPDSPLPPAWYQAIAARVRRRVPRVRIDYREPATQTDPGLTEDELAQLREALDGNILIELVTPENLDFMLALQTDESGQRSYSYLLAKVRTWSSEQAAAALKLAAEPRDEYQQRGQSPRTEADSSATTPPSAGPEPATAETAVPAASAPDTEDPEIAARRNATWYGSLLYEIQNAPDKPALDKLGETVAENPVGIELSTEQLGVLRVAWGTRNDELRPTADASVTDATAPNKDAALQGEDADEAESSDEDARPTDAAGVDVVNGVLVGYPHALPEKTKNIVQVLDHAATLSLGAPMLGQKWRRHDGIVYLSDAAAAYLKLPKTPPKAGRVITALANAGWNLGKSGLSEGYATVYRGDPKTPEHVSLRLVIVPYLRTARNEAPEFKVMGADEDDGTAPAARLARRQIRLGILTGTPMLYTEGVTGLGLLRQLRPEKLAVRDETGRYERDADNKLIMRQAPFSVEMNGAAMPFCVLHAAHPDARDRTDDQVAQEEDYGAWVRGGDRYSPEFTEVERGHPYAISFDTVTSFASVLTRLPVPLGSYRREASVRAAAAGRSVHGFGTADLSKLKVDELLPHFATPSGLRPEGPRPYSFHTLKYAHDHYGWDGPITDCWVTDRAAALFEHWWGALRDVYLNLMAECGVAPDLTDQEFIDAYARYKQVGDPDTVALIAMIKSLYKATIGKFRQGPRKDEEEAAWAERIATDPWARTDIRAYVLAAARCIAHYRYRKTLELTGRAPFAVWHDAAVYTTATDSPLEIGKTLYGPNGKPIGGTVRLGARPGCMKPEGIAPIGALLARVAETGHQPVVLAKRYDPSSGTFTKVVDEDDE